MDPSSKLMKRTSPIQTTANTTFLPFAYATAAYTCIGVGGAVPPTTTAYDGFFPDPLELLGSWSVATYTCWAGDRQGDK